MKSDLNDLKKVNRIDEKMVRKSTRNQSNLIQKIYGSKKLIDEIDYEATTTAMMDKSSAQ
jgi:hypothetical protein